MRSILKKSLRDSRNTMLWISIGMVAYILMIMSFWPTLLERQEEFDALLQDYPPALMDAFMGGMDVEQMSLASPDIFMNIYFGTWLLLIMGAVIMVQAFNALTNAERDNTMDMILSLPISRQDMLLGRLVNTAVTILAVLTASFLAFVGSTLFIDGFDVSIGRLALGIYSAFFLLMAQAAFTYMLAALVPASKRWAGPVAYAFFFGSYLVYSFAGNADVLESLKPLLLFDYYNAGEVIRDGLDITGVLVLSVVILVFGGLAWWQIDRKELGV